MTAFPKDGSTFVVESIDRTAYRWAKYKPDGARQMGKPGRWQKQVWSGDWFKWENCEEPIGELSPPIEDGPISKAFKEAGALDHWRHEVGKLHSRIAGKDAEIANLREALSKAADQLSQAHDDAFRQAAGYGLVTYDGRDFSCFELNKCGTAAREALNILAGGAA
jgi:hypothetical protein